MAKIMVTALRSFFRYGAAQIFSAILEHLGSATLDVLDPGVSF